MSHSPNQVSVDENDVGSQFFSTFRDDSLRLTVLDNDSFDRSVESEVGTVAFSDFSESFRNDRETAERVKDSFAVLGVLKEVVSSERIER